ncbi:MAG: ABC transporter substrate-binding protein, partial [Anaerolineales bacterium]
MNKKWTIFGLVAIAGLILAACGTAPADTSAQDAQVATLQAQLDAAQSGETASEEELAALQAELEAAQAAADAAATEAAAAEAAAAEAAAAEEAAAAGGEGGQVYRIGIFEDPLTTNYWSYLGPDNSVWTAYILSGEAPSLYTLSDQRFDFVPSLADGLPGEPTEEGDFVTITVKMQEGPTWSDGEPITAHDVVFTVSTSLDLQLTGNWSSIYRPTDIDHVEAVDDYTVKFYFNSTPGLAVWQYAAAQGPILPEHFYGDAVAEARSFIEGVTEPDVERPEDCEAADADADACAAWATYDEAFENARKTLYEAEFEDIPTGGGYATSKFEPGAFVERVQNDSYYFAGAQITEYDDGTWQMALPSGDTFQLYGDGSGEAILDFTGGPYAPQVVFSIYGDQNAAFLALADGEIDYVLNPLSLARGLREQAQQGSDVVTYTNADNGLFYLAFNMRKLPMALPEFREAVDFLIDKEFVADTVLQGSVTPTYSVVPPGNGFWFNPDVATPQVGLSREERINKAVEILKAAGWSWETEPAWNEDRQDVDPGVGMRMPADASVRAGGALAAPAEQGQLVPDLTILGPGPAYDPQRAVFNQWISEWMRELGVPVESELTGFNTILTPVFIEANFDLYILGWGLSIYPDYLVDFFHSSNDTAISGNYNTPGLHSDAFDAAGDAFLAETDIQKAQALAYELQDILAQERPYIPLFNRQSIDLISRNVHVPYTEVLGGISDASG